MFFFQKEFERSEYFALSGVKKDRVLSGRTKMTERSDVKKDRVQVVGPKRQKDLTSRRTVF